MGEGEGAKSDFLCQTFCVFLVFHVFGPPLGRPTSTSEEILQGR